MNVELLRKVEKAILENPEQFYMGAYFMPQASLKHPITNCGTAACISGWAITIAENTNPAKAEAKFVHYYERRLKQYPGMDVLGLTPQQAERLFLLLSWPPNYITTYVRCYGSQDWLGAAKVGVKRIEHFIETKGEE